MKKRTMILAVAACALLSSCALYDTAARVVGLPEHEEMMAGGRVASPMMMAAPENEYQAAMMRYRAERIDHILGLKGGE